MRAYQAVWTAPISSRLLAEAAFSGMGFSYGREKRGNNRELIQVTDQVGPITYRSMTWRPAVSFTPRYRGSLSYVTGTHNMKVGFDEMHNISDRIWYNNRQGLLYRFNNGVPNQLTMILDGFRQEAEVRGGALYAQDQWTLGRFTAQGGTRFDWGSSSVPEQTVGPDRWIPTPFTFPARGEGDAQRTEVASDAAADGHPTDGDGVHRCDGPDGATRGARQGLDLVGVDDEELVVPGLRVAPEPDERLRGRWFGAGKLPPRLPRDLVERPEGGDRSRFARCGQQAASLRHVHASDAFTVEVEHGPSQRAETGLPGDGEPQVDGVDAVRGAVVDAHERPADAMEALVAVARAGHESRRGMVEERDPVRAQLDGVRVVGRRRCPVEERLGFKVTTGGEGPRLGRPRVGVEGGRWEMVAQRCAAVGRDHVLERKLDESRLRGRGELVPCGERPHPESSAIRAVAG
jgi:hypothetical protein